MSCLLRFLSFEFSVKNVIRVVLVVMLGTWLCNANEEAEAYDSSDFLNEESVVVITGAAGFLGSELAMALHWTYAPKKIICVDSMDIGIGSAVKTPSQRTTTSRTAEDMGVFEFKRLRLFHVMQTLGSRGEFLRADFRPSIPEYYDKGEVPTLDSLFANNPDITHVVHLADPQRPPSLIEEYQQQGLQSQAVPRRTQQIKAGMMESLLEQLQKVGKHGGKVPHFVYASSFHVYNHLNPTPNSPNTVPFSEEKPVDRPSSLHGASKLLDEIIAQTYFDTSGIFSVGLRFFQIYGPWDSPGTILFEMAERAVTGQQIVTEKETKILDDKRDYVHIDDAVDAIMTAMQFKPPQRQQQNPIVVNVGTGKGSTLREIANHMKEHMAFQTDGKDDVSDTESEPSVSYASTKRAEELLGFTARVEVKDGLLDLLAWHHDRAFPYGSGSTGSNAVESKGVLSCSPFDTECLRGTPVFPCSSECAHPAQCSTSAYDDVIPRTLSFTAECDVVLYTVNLDNTLTTIPSAGTYTTKRSYIEGKGDCNLAFVAASSPLAQASLSSSSLKHDFWTLVLVETTPKESVWLESLPKLSPGRFFSDSVKRAIYCDSDVVIESIQALLEEASMQPFNMGSEGATAMLIGKGSAVRENQFQQSRLNSAVQNSVYRSVRLSVIEEMSRGEFGQHLDTSFLVHTLNSDDSRLFRCDIFGELVQWEVGSDHAAVEFIIELHDMWSRIIAEKDGQTTWWIGENVVTIPESHTDGSPGSRNRRLEEENEATQKGNPGTDTAPKMTQERVEALNVPGVSLNAEIGDSAKGAPLRIESEGFEERGGGTFGIEDAEGKPGNREQLGVLDSEDGGKDDDSLYAEKPETNEDISSHKKSDYHRMKRDRSAYDTWMGVLSSTSLHYFVRIVPSSEAGVVVLDTFDESQYELFI